MRVRLPPSVIANIESHLRPDFRPALSLSTVLTHNNQTVVPPQATRGARSCSPGPSVQAGAVSSDTSFSSSRSVGNDAFEISHDGFDSSISGIGPAAQASTARTVVYDDHTEPLHVPHLLRNSPKSQSHLDTAHQYLTSQPFDPGSSVSRLRRQITYSKLISTFLTHPQGLTAVDTFLQRSMVEGIPISVPTLTAILRSVLSSSDVNERMKIVHGILPLLPERLDVPLLDVLLRTVIKDTGPEPDIVQKMIVNCLKLDQLGSKEKWPWEVWDLLVLAYAQRGDFRGAIKVLAEFKETIRSHKRDKLNTHSSASQSTSSTSSSTLTRLPNVQEEKGLGSMDRQAICKVYQTALKAYRRHRLIQNDRQTRRSAIAQSALVPRQLAADLIDLLDGERPSTGFLNAWLRIERENGEVEIAENVWRIITRDYHDADAGESDPDSVGSRTQAGAAVTTGIRGRSHIDGARRAGDSALDMAGKAVPELSDANQSALASAQEGPDSESWRSLFALYDPSSSARLSSLPPIRRSLRRLFLQHRSQTKVTTSHNSPLFTTPLLNSVVRALLNPSSIAYRGSAGASAAGVGTQTETSTKLCAVDFPALLIVIQQMRWADVQPDRRTIDRLSASIVKHVANALPLHQQVEIGFHPKYHRLHSNHTSGAGARSDGVSRRWQRMGLGLVEWDMISEVVHQTRLRQYHLHLEEQRRKRQVTDGVGIPDSTEEDPYPEMVYLPLSMPVGRLTGQDQDPGQVEAAQSRLNDCTSQSERDPLPRTQHNRNADTSTSTNVLSSLSLSASTSTTSEVPAPGAKQSLSTRILPALVTLIERIIVASARDIGRLGRDGISSETTGRANPGPQEIAESGNAAKAGAGNGLKDMDGMNDQEVLRSVMLPVEEEITPRQL
ncbi:hypothetical protein IAU59_003731 [Kwoniella sp. CBS 9459]